jgi:hypothetical protein
VVERSGIDNLIAEAETRLAEPTAIIRLVKVGSIVLRVDDLVRQTAVWT